MPSDSDVSAGTVELAVLRKLQHPAQKRTHNQAEKELEELECIRVARARNEDRPIQMIHNINPGEEGLPFWGRTYRGQSPIIPHTEDETPDSVVKYDECHHDVAAIHLDAIPSGLDHKEGENAIRYLHKTLSKQLRKITNYIQVNEKQH